VYHGDLEHVIAAARDEAQEREAHDETDSARNPAQ
jgi:hypothetical protein